MVLDKHNKIVVITTNPFPVGLAATNRILSYGHGFLHHGYQPEVICIRPTEPYANVFNNQVSGIYNGIRFSYPGQTTVRVKSFWGRRCKDLVAIFYSILFFISLLQKKEVSFSIFYGTNIYNEILFLSISRLFGNKIYKEESENPNVYFRDYRSIHNKIIKWFYLNKLYRYYDGVLVMTQPLRNLFLGKGINDSKILVVPQTVDLYRFETTNERNSNNIDYEYIAYVGSLNQNKDGILTLVESFKNVSKKFPELKLIIAGDGTIYEKSTILALVKSLKLENRVQLIGRISSEEIPQFLKCAKVLASCRPATMQSDYGFPTKVVEYLASGIPTVTTATGELPLYLLDRNNSFISNEADSFSFEAKLIEVLEDYRFSLEVAKAGKKLVEKMFDSEKNTRLIIDFVNK